MSALIPANCQSIKNFQQHAPLPFTDRDYISLEGANHLAGLTCLHVQRHGDEMISMIFDDGSFAVMMHHDDCCENVEIEDINGDLTDLLDARLDVAEEREQDDPDAAESGTWTFYCLRTIKGSIDIRWYGSSSGFYSESVSLDIRRPAVPLSQHERLTFTEKVKAFRAAKPS